MAFGLKKYKVIAKGRSGLTYKEGDKTISVDSEQLSESLGIAIFTDSIKSWDVPYNEQAISDEDRNCIIENIKKDLEKKKRKVILVSKGVINNETASAPGRNQMKPDTRPETESY